MNKACDIIIPVWNNMELTRDCVNSIIEYTSFPYRIIIIDNASDDPTRRYLENTLRENRNNIVLIRNEENKGFVKAVNQGMRYSSAPYICVMNNDTLATEGWLGEMTEILEKNPDIGIINPSSNTSCQFPGKLTIHAYAKNLKAFKGLYQELYTCRAFSMVLKKEVAQKIGYLDDSYGMGYFDDTDYCKRAQKAGYRTVRAKASYVYHKESQSFSKYKKKSELFLANEKKFNSKWGKPLRIAYVIPVASDNNWREISANINKIAKSGHQVWIFTNPAAGKNLKLIDHESIRFFYYPGFFFGPIALYKIWKRKKNKKLNVILTSSAPVFELFEKFKGLIESEVFMDKNTPLIESELHRASFVE